MPYTDRPGLGSELLICVVHRLRVESLTGVDNLTPAAVLIKQEDAWESRYRTLTRSRVCSFWGLGRFFPLLDLHVGIPSFEHRGPFSVQGLHPGLQEQVRTAF
jgi:hypothetical protein